MNMATTAAALNLEPNNLAFVFDSEIGVSAADLGLFLQRASTVSRRAGVDLYVIGLHEGSLAVVARALRKGGQAGIDEFRSSPIRTAASAAALVGMATAAIAAAMIPRPGDVSPLAKAGAGLVEHHSVTQISLVTTNRTTIVMDEKRAAEVRMLESERHYDALPSPDVRQLMASAINGNLSGTVLLVDGELHFRPDGFRYLVPVDRSAAALPEVVRPGRHLVVWGQLLLRNTQPDMLVIREARAE
jgi:hypothetical protein